MPCALVFSKCSRFLPSSSFHLFSSTRPESKLPKDFKIKSKFKFKIKDPYITTFTRNIFKSFIFFCCSTFPWLTHQVSQNSRESGCTLCSTWFQPIHLSFNRFPAFWTYFGVRLSHDHESLHVYSSVGRGLDPRHSISCLILCFERISNNQGCIGEYTREYLHF